MTPQGFDPVARARVVERLLEEWGLTRDGDPAEGFTAVVTPVVTASGERAALKVAYAFDEGQHEILALRHWHGAGAVRLLRGDPRRRAMLLERLDSTDLRAIPVLDACEVIAGLYGLLHVAAPPQLVPLSQYVARWTDDLDKLRRNAAVPRRMVEQAVHLGRAFVSDAATDGVMIHTDLHYENVLAGERAPWLAIDPQPVSGDPHYEVAPLLWNRWDEVLASGDVRAAVRRRFHTTVDAAGLDEERARDWVIVREAHNAMWGLEDREPDAVAVAVAIIKAVQD